MAGKRRRRKDLEYRVRVKGEISPDLTQRISKIHAKAILNWGIGSVGNIEKKDTNFKQAERSNR